jgi:hypothetical protein
MGARAWAQLAPVLGAMARRPFWVWPVVVAASGLAIELVLAFDIHGPLRVVLALWFLMVCPGLPYVRMLRLTSRMVEWPLIVALSLALDTVVTTTLAYVRAWSAADSMLILIAVSVVGAALLFEQGQRSS